MLYEPKYITENAARNFADIDMNFIPHPISGDIPVVRGTESIRRAIKHLVLLEHYEKFRHPDIGCDVYRTLFEILELPGTEDQLRRSITDMITNYEPRAEIHRIDIESRPDDNGVNVSIWFIPVNAVEPIIIEIFLKILR